MLILKDKNQVFLKILKVKLGYWNQSVRFPSNQMTQMMWKIETDGDDVDDAADVDDVDDAADVDDVDDAVDVDYVGFDVDDVDQLGIKSRLPQQSKTLHRADFFPGTLRLHT